jgi:hypothetical protein
VRGERPTSTHGAPASLRRRLTRSVITTVVAVLLVSGGSGLAWAWWTATSSVSATVSAGGVDAVTGLRCTTNSQLFYDDRIVVSWDPVTAPVPPGGRRQFIVTLTPATGSPVTTSVAEGTSSVSIGWAQLDVPAGSWTARRTIRVTTSVTFGTPVTATWVSAAATPATGGVAVTGSSTTFFGTTYRNLACVS